MMVEMTNKMQKFFEEMTSQQKIRMFYELANYIINNAEDVEDEDMNNLFDDIANVIHDINNL